MRVVFGIGNPGPRYAGTRHNLGFLVVDALAADAGVSLRPLPGRAAEGVRGRLEGRDVRLVRPLTYVNLCGPVLASVLAEESLPAADVLVVVDDLALEPGRLRLRAGGSDGGHNGLRSIAGALGTESFPRLRIGIGRPPPGVPAERFVLEPFGPGEGQGKVVAAATGAVRLWLRLGLDAAMAEVNRRDLDPGSDPA